MKIVRTRTKAQKLKGPFSGFITTNKQQINKALTNNNINWCLKNKKCENKTKALTNNNNQKTKPDAGRPQASDSQCLWQQASWLTQRRSLGTYRPPLG